MEECQFYQVQVQKIVQNKKNVIPKEECSFYLHCCIKIEGGICLLVDEIRFRENRNISLALKNTFEYLIVKKKKVKMIRKNVFGKI